MKSVLISIQPKWVEKICNEIGKENGKPIYEKVVEVRKTRPKIETPFKCYIYCTISNGVKGDYLVPSGIQCGKVIGEFVCDKITALYNVATTSWDLLYGDVHDHAKNLVRKACLTDKEIHDYAKGKDCYGWHISDLVIYDKPKNLSEFRTFCDGVGGKIGCKGCEYYDFENTESGSLEICCCDNLRPLKRPPQSWCYVESLGE